MRLIVENSETRLIGENSGTRLIGENSKTRLIGEDSEARLIGEDYLMPFSSHFLQDTILIFDRDGMSLKIVAVTTYADSVPHHETIHKYDMSRGVHARAQGGQDKENDGVQEQLRPQIQRVLPLPHDTGLHQHVQRHGAGGAGRHQGERSLPGTSGAGSLHVFPGERTRSLGRSDECWTQADTILA
ncbi:hypothetical protein TNCT_359251 [Trichonephila clavata]|uniref:Uncharacterized protein n=1 Tax=Trichonephila clavata TaxID=2740835 RepID=A0A8X6JZI5_TRICU|nr:hypothetical protein TNCT_359251 [Trichonephila clavata]